MDGHFISTDIRYRELMNNRRRSTSYRKIRSPGGGVGRSKSVDASFIGGAIGNISEEVGGVEGAIGGGGGGSSLVDEVFEPMESVGGAMDLNVGGAVPRVDEEVHSNTGALKDGVERKEDESVGIKEGDGEEIIDGAVGGAEVPGDVDVENVGKGAVEGLEVPVLVESRGGARDSLENVLEEGEIEGGVGNNREGGEDVLGMGGFEEFGCGGAEGVSSANVSGGAESVVEPVHHIPRWKLYEILAHAEGEYVISVL